MLRFWINIGCHFVPITEILNFDDGYYLYAGLYEFNFNIFDIKTYILLPNVSLVRSGHGLI